MGTQSGAGLEGEAGSPGLERRSLFSKGQRTQPKTRLPGVYSAPGGAMPALSPRQLVVQWSLHIFHPGIPLRHFSVCSPGPSPSCLAPPTREGRERTAGGVGEGGPSPRSGRRWSLSLGVVTE